MLRSFTIATAALLSIALTSPSFAKGGAGGGKPSMSSPMKAPSGGGAKKKGGGPPDLSFLDTGAENACPTGQTNQCRASAFAGRPDICGCTSRK